MTMNIKGKMILFMVFAALVCIFAHQAANAADVPRMTKETLNGLLGNPGVLILDVRSGTDWNSTDSKIQGAERANPNNLTTWMEKYPKGITLVLY